MDDPTLDPQIKMNLQRQKEEEKRRENSCAILYSRRPNPIVPPVCFISVDPFITWIREVYYTVPDTMLVEQLYMDKDVFGQCSALSNMSRARHGSNRRESRKLRLEAMFDCLVGSLIPEEVDAVQHSIYVKAEAAFALARYEDTINVACKTYLPL